MKKTAVANKRKTKRDLSRAMSRAESRGKPKDTMREEYRFDYSKAKPNRFATQMSGSSIAVVLDPDVAVVFQSSEAVNSLLRSVISAMPEEKHGPRS